MSVPFSTIPSNLRVPLFWVEIDNSAAGTPGGDNPKSLLIAQKKPGGSATANLPVMVTSANAAAGLFGDGSDLHRMSVKYFANDPFGELWALPVDDNGAGTEATVTLAFNGPATADGTIFLYLGGNVVTAAVNSGDSAGDVRDAVHAAISAASGLGVSSATNGASDLDVTHDHKGTTGNSFDVRANYAGAVAGESYPAGVSITAGGNDIESNPTHLAGGATNPSLTTAIANMGDEPFDYICHPYPSATELNAVSVELSDRWGALKQIYGHAFTAKSDTVGNLTTLGNSRNDPHHTIVGYELMPTTEAELAAAYMGAVARELKIDPARPCQTIALEGVSMPRINDAFTATEQNTLLHDGIATLYRGGGKVRVTRAITTYQKDAFDNADDSFLDVNTLATLQYILRFLSARITSKFPRHKLVSDGVNFGSGQAVVSPSTIKAELVSAYMELESAALVENRAAFIKNLTVERNSGDANRVDVLFPPDLANQLRVFAMLTQFRLQYPANAAS